MKTIICLLLAAPLVALAVTEEHLNKQFTAQPGGTLIVDVDFGSVNVATNATNLVTVDASRRITRRTKAEEEAYLKENPISFSQDGGAVTIRARAQHSAKRGWTFGNNNNEGKYSIAVPAQFSADIKTAGGDIAIEDLTGKVNAGTSGGGLDFAKLHGPLNGDTSGGDIRLAECEGTIRIRTSGGGIEASGGSGSLKGETSGGSIAVKSFRGPARIETSGGPIFIERVAGEVEGSTSGGSISAVVEAPMAGDLKLSTSGGDVTAQLPANAAFELDAETSGGDVSTELPVTVVGKLERSRLKGPVNGGGHLVRLRTSGGDIRIKKNPEITLEAPNP